MYMEASFVKKKNKYGNSGQEVGNLKIWAHRGCSQRYPENTLLAFEKAMKIEGLEGIELDIQLTRDGELVVIHDERVDRTTEGIGFVRDFTLYELKKLHIYADVNQYQTVLTMEEKIVDLVHKRGLQDNIIYSSFYAVSLEKVKKLDPAARTGVLDSRVSDCLFKVKGVGADALHPFWQGMDLPKERMEGYAVRVWLSGHLYPEKPTGTKPDLDALERQGITDVFLNEPEVYL